MQLSQLQKEIQDRTHDLDMRALEMRNSVRGSGDTPKPIVPQRSVGVNTEPMTEEISASNPNNAVAFNMLMRIFKRGNGAIKPYMFHIFINTYLFDDASRIER